MAARGDERVRLFRTRPPLAVARVLGLGLAILMVTGAGPSWLHDKGVGGLMWGVLVASVGLIVPLGAAVLSVLVGYGLIELVGGWMRPIMRPVFRLPGRAALDDLMSWLGSYSVGLYVTRKLVDQGRYTRREAFLIATGFSTVSVGFVGVVCSTLELLHLFPLVFGTYFVLVYLLAAIQARTWPATSIPDTLLGEGLPEPEPEPGRSAWELAMQRAQAAPSLPKVLWAGWLDGLALAATILGTILAVGTGATLLAETTPLFTWLGQPLIPVLTLLGLPDAPLLGPAVVAGITEMYIPALLVRDAAIEGRFFIAVLSISQLIFFSSVAPMMLDMFEDLPITTGHLVALFFLRTALLVPLIAGLTHLYSALGWLVPG
jgi:nucleoside recognition membrane protein YjiH